MGTHMERRHAVLFLFTLLFLVPCSPLFAQSNQQQSVPVPTLRVTSSLVFLDVTVLDKKGNPVVTGLTKENFIVTEDKRQLAPAAQSHAATTNPAHIP